MNYTLEYITDVIQKTKLSDREKYVLSMRMNGVSMDEICKTLKPPAYIGKEHITRERVRQLESRAIRKLRDILIRAKVYA